MFSAALPNRAPGSLYDPNMSTFMIGTSRILISELAGRSVASGEYTYIQHLRLVNYCEALQTAVLCFLVSEDLCPTHDPLSNCYLSDTRT